MKQPIQQAKEHILKMLKNAPATTKEIIYPCLRVDEFDYRSALELIDVQAEFNRRGIKATIRVQNSKGKPLPNIIIATVEDAANGKLDEYLKQYDI
jgi:MFS superfamily sulfate permease-like transporter